MAKSAAIIADEIRVFLNKNSIDVWTMEWSKFYELTERERMKFAFQESLKQELESRAVLLVYGRFTVVICRDFNFSPRDFP